MKAKVLRDKQLMLFRPQYRHYQLVNDLIAAVQSPGNVIVSLVSVKDTAKTAEARVRHRRLELGAGPTDRFRKVALGSLLQLLDRLDDGHLVRQYSGATKLNDDEIEHLSLALETRIRDRVDLLSDPLGFPVFSDQKDFMSGLRYYVITIQPDEGEPIHCFHSYSEVFELHRSRWITLIQGYGSSYFDQVEQTGFLFYDEIDCLCRGDDMLIVNKDRFQRIFGFYEHVQRDASEAIGELNKRVPIANIAEVIAATKRDSRMAIRLADLPRRRAFHHLSLRHLKRVIQEEGLNVRTEMQDGREALVYSPRYKSEFIHLLCDDYVIGHATRLHYESSAKRELAGSRRRKRVASPALRAV